MSQNRNQQLTIFGGARESKPTISGQNVPGQEPTTYMLWSARESKPTISGQNVPGHEQITYALAEACKNKFVISCGKLTLCENGS